MAYKNEIRRLLKIFCLKRRLYSLERKRRNVIQSFIESNPSSAAKADNIESRINQEHFIEIDIKIKAVQKLLKKINN